jgi:Lrp/AsnC family transcriptional regulator, leucine-responsive regulatory protein
LLALIQRDGRKSYAQLGERVGLSPAAVHGRLMKLHKAGILRHWSAAVSADAIGYPVLAYIRIQTDMPANARGLAEIVTTLPEILECHYIGGEWNCLLKVRAATQAELDAFVAERITPLPGILRLQIEQVTSSAKESHIIPTAAPQMNI